ncbi:ATPase MORC2A-like [Heterodontus francisci]|uniref:ATPase MORC2A-like n=1 Tax=Heterodontus francisci TaxID=7792 RepID=UPI00355C3F88
MSIKNTGPNICSAAITSRVEIVNSEWEEALPPTRPPPHQSICALQADLKYNLFDLQKTVPIKPLAYKLPSDLSNKSVSEGIAASESNPFSLPSSSRRRRIPSFYAIRYKRSESSESIPLSQSICPKSSRNGKTVRIHGKFRSAVRSEKQSYSSVHSTEENTIRKMLMASQPRKKHLQALQKEQVNTHNFKVETPQRELVNETTKEIIAAPVSNVYRKYPTSLNSDYITQALVKQEPLKDGDTVAFTYKPCFWQEVKANLVSFGNERFQNENVQDGTAGSSLSAPCNVAGHMVITKPGISNTTVEGIVTCFRNLLSHFIPPNYHISKEKLKCMAAEELVTFPMHHYFFHYEKALRARLQSSSENVITRAQEIEQKIQQAEIKLQETKEKLKFYQKVTLQLLNKFHTPSTLHTEES